MIVALDDRHTYLGASVPEAVIGLDHSGVPYALSRVYALYMDARRYVQVAVGSGLDHHGLYIVDGLRAMIEYLEHHVARLTAADDIVAVGIDKPGIAYLNSRRIGDALGYILHARRAGEHLYRLVDRLAGSGGAVGCDRLASADALDAVVATIVGIKAAAVAFIAVLYPRSLTALLTAGRPPLAVHILVGLPLLAPLVLGTAYDATYHGATSHTYYGAYIMSTGTIADAPNSTTQNTSERGAGIGTLSGVGATTAYKHQGRHG